MTEGRAGLRIRVLALLVVLMFAALSTRLWYLQVLASGTAKGQVQQQSIRIVDVPAPRGQILDDRGRVLVGNRMSLEALINRQRVGANPDAMVLRLSQVTGVPVRVIASRLKSNQYLPYTPVPVAFGIGQNAAYYIDEHPSEFPGVTVTTQPVRTYPYGELAAHVLGYTGQITAAQFKDPTYAGYSQTAIVGRDGVELWYEHQLQGTAGKKKYQVDATGRNLGEIGVTQPPTPGKNVMLSIDAKVQKLTEQSLQLGMEAARHQIDTATNKYFKANAGAVVVMRPDGSVVAMASSPTYSPDVFVRGVTQSQYRRDFLRKSLDQPLLDRALQGQYPPGSAFKPFIALSALRDGVVSTGRTYPCPPSYRVPGDTSGTVFKNWAFPADLGSMTLAQALVESCDTVFYPMGYAYWGLYYPPTNPPKLPLERDLGEFGFGKPTLIDLPGETNHGLIPTPESKQTSLHQQFLPGDFINMSIGQGGVLATPLQVADAYAAIANGGHLCVPHVATQIQTPDGANRRIKAECHKLPFSASDIQYVRNAMEGVVRPPGTAASAFTGFPFARVPVAGKTGTAQVNGEQDSSWFAAIAGSGADQYVIVALVQQGGHGSTTAAPIVRRVIEGLFGLGTSPKIQTQAPQD